MRREPIETTGRRMDRSCWRCGVQWVDTAASYRRDAPCIDCRAALRSEGIPADQWRARPKGQNVGDLTHPLHPHRVTLEATA